MVVAVENPGRSKPSATRTSPNSSSTPLLSSSLSRSLDRLTPLFTALQNLLHSLAANSATFLSSWSSPTAQTVFSWFIIIFIGLAAGVAAVQLDVEGVQDPSGLLMLTFDLTPPAVPGSSPVQRLKSKPLMARAYRPVGRHGRRAVLQVAGQGDDGGVRRRHRAAGAGRLAHVRRRTLGEAVAPFMHQRVLGAVDLNRHGHGSACRGRTSRPSRAATRSPPSEPAPTGWWDRRRSPRSAAAAARAMNNGPEAAPTSPEQSAKGAGSSPPRRTARTAHQGEAELIDPIGSPF